MATLPGTSARGVRSGLCCFWFFGSECGPAGPVLIGLFIPLFFIRGGYRVMMTDPNRRRLDIVGTFRRS